MATFHRSPGFFVARGFLGVCLVLGVAGVVYAIAPVVSGDSVYRDFARGRPDSVTVRDPALWLSSIDAAPGVLGGLTMLVAAFLLLVVVVDIQRGVPFEAKADRRLRAAAVLVAVGSVTYAFLSAWADTEVLQARGKRSREFGFYFLDHISAVAPWLVVAALLAVFGYAFREGRRLVDDNAGLV